VQKKMVYKKIITSQANVLNLLTLKSSDNDVFSNYELFHETELMLLQFEVTPKSSRVNHYRIIMNNYDVKS
jgi:hypothetical protein